MTPDSSAHGLISVTVEFYGLARILIGQKSVEVALPAGSTVRDLLAELGAQRPELVGRVLQPDYSGVTDGQSLAIDGLSFIDRPESATLHGGERVLILANAAGGAAATDRSSRPPHPRLEIVCQQ